MIFTDSALKPSHNVCVYVCLCHCKTPTSGYCGKEVVFFTGGKGGIPLVPKSLKHRVLYRPTVDYVGAKGKALVDN